MVIHDKVGTSVGWVFDFYNTQQLWVFDNKKTRIKELPILSN